ncbi:MAG: aminodeoxychorismate synthase component I [Peptococcaceae bacterium]|nr:aminodeoxychorismate synthase component I [Peptococcaceae bacterium]
MSEVVPLVIEIELDGTLEEVFAIYKDDPHPFWLDSSRPGGRMGRWSYMGSSPFLVLKTTGQHIVIVENGERREYNGDPFAVLQAQLDRFRLPPASLPMPFTGGAVGYFSYDLGRMVEVIPNHSIDDLQVPDMYLGFYERVLAIDHDENRAYLVATGLPYRGEEALRRAECALMEGKNKLSRPLVGLSDPWAEPSISAADLKAHFTHETYCAAIRKVKEYIARGDIYQANMTQRLEAPLRMPPYQLYRRLRQVNPAPFAAYLDCGEGLCILSSSPERFLLLDHGVVEARPIKGTRPRGRTPDEDNANREELLASEKDRAELVMIIDLERNDLGRVCTYGTVRVPELIVLEEYATVFHLVSTVRGELAPGKSAVDLLKATFPGGSITGAPKIRAMEIIEELEPVRRGIYTGAIGYLGFDGRVDLNIAIRTLVNQDDRLYLQVGGGIVTDSDPAAEYAETWHKAKAPLRSLGIMEPTP